MLDISLAQSIQGLGYLLDIRGTVVKLTTHHHLAPKLMPGAISPFLIRLHCEVLN
jgi:hypothetical protein